MPLTIQTFTGSPPPQKNGSTCPFGLHLKPPQPTKKTLSRKGQDTPTCCHSRHMTLAWLLQPSVPCQIEAVCAIPANGIASGFAGSEPSWNNANRMSDKLSCDCGRDSTAKVHDPSTGLLPSDRINAQVVDHNAPRRNASRKPQELIDTQVSCTPQS